MSVYHHQVEFAVIEILCFLHFPDEVRGNHSKLCEQSKRVYYEIKKNNNNKIIKKKPFTMNAIQPAQKES